ncbi:MAG: hypothetical protein ACTS73_00315 [Arsenophonus sp. NEOnobi-MAG3]
MICTTFISLALADGIYIPVTQDDHLSLVVITSLTEHGRKKKLIALKDAYQKSETNWAEFLNSLRVSLT